METAEMGKVLVPAVIENLDDLFAAKKGQIPVEQVRRIEVTDALIDSGATGLLMPKRMVEALGLTALYTRSAKTAAGIVQLNVYRAVRLAVQGRDCISDVSEIADDLPVIIGQIPLENMDWVIDMRGRQLIGNPAHGGEHILEVF